MNKVLKLLCEDARLSVEELSAMTGLSPEEVAGEMQRLEENGTILGYRAIVDWDKAESDLVESYIDLKIAPKKSSMSESFGKRLLTMSASERDRKIVSPQ